jgi:ubiquinone/menaquinone biosynthesis C-methylase UbiE
VSDDRDHYSYTVYADPDIARRFDARRFGGPIGDLVAGDQAAVLRAFLGPIAGRRILDVGTGTGRAAFLMAEAGAQVVGVDASEEMLAMARARQAEQPADVTFQAGDAHALAFPDQSFDIAVSLRVIMHTPRWRQCIAELCRVSRHLVIVDYPSARSVALPQSIARKFVHAAGGKTEPYRVFLDSQIRHAFDAGGFRVRETARQWVLPIAVHKAIGSRGFTLGSESVLRKLGFLSAFGSPVTVVAERCKHS